MNTGKISGIKLGIINLLLMTKKLYKTFSDHLNCTKYAKLQRKDKIKITAVMPVVNNNIFSLIWYINYKIIFKQLNAE